MLDSPITRRQWDYIESLLIDCGVTHTDNKRLTLDELVGKRDIDSLTSQEASFVIDHLKKRKDEERP